MRIALCLSCGERGPDRGRRGSRLALLPCPDCGERTLIRWRHPKPGDPTHCTGCARLLHAYEVAPGSESGWCLGCQRAALARSQYSAMLATAAGVPVVATRLTHPDLPEHARHCRLLRFPPGFYALSIGDVELRPVDQRWAAREVAKRERTAARQG